MRCTVQKTTEIVSKKWSLLIILAIHKGKKEAKQYSDIKSHLPNITPKILSARLKELEHHSIITKKIDNSKVPINTFYSLTPSGKDLIKIIKDIKSWGLRWKFKNKVCETSICKECTLI